MIHVESLKVEGKGFQDKSLCSYYCGKILVSGRPRPGYGCIGQATSCWLAAISQWALFTEQRPHMVDRLGPAGASEQCYPEREREWARWE